jgi:hypothetical protein
VKILSHFFETVPDGYDPIDKPMMGCKIRVDGVWQERHYYNFFDVRERFATQLAEYMETLIVFRRADAIDSDEEEANQQRAWMRRACKQEEIPEWTRDPVKLNRYLRETHERHK